MTMCVLLIIAGLGSPAILFSQDLRKLLRDNLSIVYNKVMNAYKNVLIGLTKQYINAVFLWGKIGESSKPEKYSEEYIEFIIANAPYIGIAIIILTIIAIILF